MFIRYLHHYLLPLALPPIPSGVCRSCDRLDEHSCKTPRTELTMLPLLVNTFRLAPSFALQLATLLGILLASLSILFARMRNAITYFLLFLVHSSAFQVGDTFLWFQWDTLLLEAGALCCLLAPLPFLGSSPADNISIFLVRWLVFRLMYASGVVKLTSQCPAWWSLTSEPSALYHLFTLVRLLIALNIHFESQCLPTWVAYYAHHSPEWLRRLAVAITFYIEIALPPMFLLPFKTLRAFAFYPQIVLMVSIMLTGNYNFFNAIYALHCVAMLNDSDEYNFSTKGLTARFAHFIAPIRKLISLSVISMSICCFVKYFNVEVNGFSLTTKIAFTNREFADFVEWSVLYLLYLGIAAFISEVITAIIRYWTEEHRCRVRAFIHLIYVIVIGSLFFSISLSPFATLSGSAKAVVPSPMKSLYEWSNNYQLTHAYGLFRRMTGLYGRPEVIVEGAYEPNGPWVPFNFYAKPLKLDAKPRFILPHQPRLDWQMWFAALGAYQHNPFFISLNERVLFSVTYLMDKYPFEHKLPRFIRAQLYLYHYTAPNKQGKWPVNYWRRDFQEEYMPPITKEDPNVVFYLEENGFVLKNKFRISDENKQLEERLKRVHTYFKSYDPAWLIYSLLVAHVVGIYTVKMVFG
ncbi:unnamed protein product [Toxocara canis]|uniref:Lipase maturation factor n=1 Tax=Toxocara canis TaxID=6265 RepID=A0A183UNI1_TOXCA|nr:unnamed protein product [Toxocara canis]